MRKPITILIALALAAAFPCGAPAAGTGPLSADAELPAAPADLRDAGAGCH